MPNEINDIAEWIFNTLSGDSALNTIIGAGGVCEMLIPEGETYPKVVFQLIPLNDIIGGGGKRVLTKALYKIYGVDTGDAFGANLKDISNRIDTLMDQSQLGVSDPTIIGVTRRRAHQDSYVRDDIRYLELGGWYYFEAYPYS